MLTYNFYDGNGQIPAHRHTNPDKTLGGWVADSCIVQDTVIIGEDVLVYGISCIYGNSILTENARVNNSILYDCLLAENTYVENSILSNCELDGEATVHATKK